jgi:hypothetical protein
MRIEKRDTNAWQPLDCGVDGRELKYGGDVLKLITIRRQGTIAVLGRNLAVRVLMEKTARLETRDTTINDVDREGTATENQGAPVAANIHAVIATLVDLPASQK